MRKTIGLSLFFLLVLGSFSAFAQQDAQFTQYMFNTLYYNPAYAGVDGVTSITAAHRTQWAGLRGNPVTQIISFNTPVFRLSSGFGVHFINDRLGAQNNLQFQASYAYHLHLKELNTKLSFGVRAGANALSIDEDEFIPNQADDPLLLGDQPYDLRPDMGAGVYFQSEKVFGGVGFSHLLKGRFSDSDLNRQPLTNHMSVMFGYDYIYGRKITLTPSFLVQTDFNQYIFTLTAMGNLDEKYWLGLSFRQGESINLITGYSVLKDKSLRFGYSFDFVVKGVGAKSPSAIGSSHEISLTYTLPQPTPSGKKIIRNPRFRHD
ncbi:PorP/SprF family type IX secretion system membrane protein [Nafulsella turpanensis]|uniref:PorP/SprF family type IX secretion system membrane protein n=1 Tax=Nafulsella turpanensis TaxID=1265690 RepID=UPI0003470AC6|nr:type IX secretion system membrane protein PorP/SprF [Nafulsella turpanensis]